MRRIYYLAITILTISIACKSEKATDAQEIVEAEAAVDSFTSADRAFADVRGNAKSCVVTTTDMTPSADTLKVAEDALTTTLTQNFDANGNIAQVKREDTFMDQPVGTSIFNFEFDSEGKLISSSTDLDGRFNVKRDKNGYVNTFTSIGNNGDVDYTQVYTWQGGQLKTRQMANDRKVTEGIVMPIDKATYSYDEEGKLQKMTEESGDPQLEMNVIETVYAYLDLDEHGNWTNRNVTRTAKVYKIDASGRRALTDSVATYQNEKREIVYID